MWARTLYRGRHATRAVAECLEQRHLLAGVDQALGTLEGRFFKQHTVLGSDTDVYRFHLSALGKIDIQLSRLIGTGKMILRNSFGTLINSTAVSSSDQRITFDALSVADFVLSVKADQAQALPAVAYTLAITTDVGRGARFNGSFDIRADVRRDLGTLSETGVVKAKDFVGFLDTSNHAAEDALDTYAFNVPAFGNTNFSVSGAANDPADSGAQLKFDVLLFQDLDNDGRLEGNEVRTANTLTSDNDGAMLGNIDAGRYFMVISVPLQPVANTTLGGSNYTLNLGYSAVDLARNTLATARSVTLGSTPQVFHDLLSSLDTTDVYKFTVGSGGPFAFNADMTGVASSDFDLQLIQDKNHNGAVDILNGEIIGFSQARGVTNEHISATLRASDTYFVKVNRFFGEDAYTLNMSNVSTDTAGSTLATAKNLGALANTPSVSEFVGAIDPTDVFRVSTSQPGEIRMKINNPVTGGLLVDVIRDANNDGAISATDVLASLSSGNVLDGVVLPVAGTYFVRVRPGAGDVNYNATFSFSKQTPFGSSPIQINNTSNTKIEAEAFDNGGDSDAFHDSDAVNSGGQFRTNIGVDIKGTNDPQSAGDANGAFRVTDTAVGEFLEYTVFVNQTANYDFNFRLSGNGDGAKFHIEVDGVNASGSQSVPNQHAFDAMTDLSVPRIALSRGPHVLRVAFDAGATNGPAVGFAGAYNFFTIVPSITTGTFMITPAHANVSAGDFNKFALEWTVPSGGWRVLKDVDLRVRDEDLRTVLRIRFDEATNSFRFYDTAKKTFGKAVAVGSAGVFSNQFALLRLASSSVKADGPTDPSVVITFDIAFKKKLAGRHLTIEASASDDLGNFDHFAAGGTVDVLQ